MYFILIHIYNSMHVQVEMLEWTDDLEHFILKGYGNSLNYRMGMPLLEDVVRSMEQAIQAKEGKQQIVASHKDLMEDCFLKMLWFYD